MHHLRTLTIAPHHQFGVWTLRLQSSNLRRHCGTPFRISASQIPGHGCDVSVYALDSEIGGADGGDGLECHDERGPDEDTDVAGFGGAAGKKECVCVRGELDFVREKKGTWEGKKD